MKTSTPSVSRADIQVSSLYCLRDDLAARIALRRRIGGFDWSSDSADMADAMTRAVRVWFRVVRGARVSMATARGF